MTPPARITTVRLTFLLGGALMSRLPCSAPARPSVLGMVGRFAGTSPQGHGRLAPSVAAKHGAHELPTYTAHTAER